MGYIKKLLLLLAILLIAAKALITAAIFLSPPIITPDNLEVNARELINLTNQYRLNHGLNALAVNPRLTQAAVNKARDMLSRQYFDHTSPAGKKFSDWIKEINYQYFYVGENLAIDFTDNQELFDAWLQSPKHYENIVKPQYQEIGLAAISGKFKNHPTMAVVQLFGTRILSQDNLSGGINGADTANTSSAASAKPITDFYTPGSWTALILLATLDKLNSWNNLLLILIIGLVLIAFKPQKLIAFSPQKKNSQSKIKPPTAKRYQAKTLKEYRDK